MQNYTIQSESFTTKDSLKKRIQGILYSYSPEEELSGPDALFMLCVLDMHRSSEIKIGCGVKSIFVRTNPIYKRNRGFWIKRIDGTETDFSFMECLSPSTPIKKFMTACRNSIRKDIVLFKNIYLSGGSKCPFTGELLTAENTHVDHVPPLTFDAIVHKFIQKHSIDISKVPLTGSSDGSIGEAFADESFENFFRMFHETVAELRLVSMTANLSHVKKRTNSND